MRITPFMRRYGVLLRPGVVWAAAFLFCFEGILWFFPAIGMILGSNMDFHRFYYEREASLHAEEIEVLIIGDSAVQNSVHADVIANAWGMEEGSVYSLAWGGGAPSNLTPFLRKEIQNMSRLRAVVWIMNDYRFSSKGGPYPDHLSLDSEYVWDRPTRELASTDLIPWRYSRVYRLWKMWKLPITRQLFHMRFMEEAATAPFLVTDHGGWMLLYSRDSYTLEALAWMRDPELRTKEVAAFEDLAAIFQSNGVHFYVMRHRLHDKAVAYFREHVPEFFEFSANVLERSARQYDVINDADALAEFRPSHDGYYSDYQHMTYYGAVEYSRYIAHIFQEKYGFGRD